MFSISENCIIIRTNESSQISGLSEIAILINFNMQDLITDEHRDSRMRIPEAHAATPLLPSPHLPKAVNVLLTPLTTRPYDGSFAS